MQQSICTRIRLMNFSSSNSKWDILFFVCISINLNELYMKMSTFRQLKNNWWNTIWMQIIHLSASSRIIFLSISEQTKDLIWISFGKERSHAFYCINVHRIIVFEENIFVVCSFAPDKRQKLMPVLPTPSLQQTSESIRRKLSSVQKILATPLFDTNR